MPVPPKFRKPQAAAPKKPAGASRWAGVEAGKSNDPMPHPGMYRFRVLEAVEGYNPGTGSASQKIKLEIVTIYEQASEIHTVGEVVSAIYMGTPAGMGETINMIMAAAGFDDFAAYKAYDNDGSGQATAAALGNANEFSEAGFTIVGRLFDCQVSRGKDVPPRAPETVSTDFYRKYNSAPVAEDEQDQTPGTWLA